jgi:hypothetical protein
MQANPGALEAAGLLSPDVIAKTAAIELLLRLDGLRNRIEDFLAGPFNDLADWEPEPWRIAITAARSALDDLNAHVLTDDQRIRRIE